MHESPDFAQIDAVMRLIDREVWVVTAANGGHRGGLLATWVSATSIDRERPVVVAGIAPNHFTAELVQTSRAFAAHLLRPNQTDLAWNFAKDSSRERNKLTGLELKMGLTGSPLLTDCLAWCDCRVFARYDAGDRLFFWADVIAAGQPNSGAPLREQAFIRALTDEQRKALLAARNADIQIQRPWHEKWRNSQSW